INNRPWCLLGDFNASLFVEDTSMGSSALDVTMREFKEISDHSPSVLSIPSLVKEKPMPFKIFNVVILDDRFKDVVRNGWMSQISSFYMFRVVKKLKGLKKPILKLMYDKGNLHTNVVRLREELDKVQTDLDSDPNNLSFWEKEAATVADFNEALLMEEKFLKQKEKITWLKEGDSNTAYFHKVIKSRVSRSRIDVVTNANGNVHHSTDVAKAFINHYEIFLGQPGNTSDFNTDNLFPTRLNDSEALNMVRDISSQETYFVLQRAFKCISKIIANRLKDSLKRLVSPNQSAFVPGRCISDNILLTQEIMHNYIWIVEFRGVPLKLIFKKRMTRLIGISYG
nr:hypothetical protein [Tanacetum cinerariifolium]